MSTEPEAAEHKEINVNEESVHQQQLRLNESQCQDSTISFKTNLEEKENKQFPSAVEKGEKKILIAMLSFTRFL